MTGGLSLEIVAYLNEPLQLRHSLRRLALRVPHDKQRTYIVRANQFVMNALPPRIKMSTAAFRRKSFNPFESP